VVPENIHTPTMEGIGNSGGVGVGGVKHPGNSRGEGLDSQFGFQTSFDSIWNQVSI